MYKMPAGTHGKTSSIFYRRGIPNNNSGFGAIANGNYTIFQPTNAITNKVYFNKFMTTFISNNK